MASGGDKSLIVYALVARGKVVLAEFTATSGNFPTVTRQLLEKIPPRDGKMSYVYDRCGVVFLSLPLQLLGALATLVPWRVLATVCRRPRCLVSLVWHGARRELAGGGLVCYSASPARLPSPPTSTILPPTVSGLCTGIVYGRPS